MEVHDLPTAELVAPPGPERPEGLHASDIINDISKTLDPKRYGKTEEPDHKQTKIMAGMAFERALELLFTPAQPACFRPASIFIPVPGYKTFWQGKVYPGGFWVSPDMVDPTQPTPTWVVREFKLTWYSAKKELPLDEVYFPWVSQIKIYCKALGTKYAILTVLFINGDYAPPRPQKPVSRGLVFTDLELEENFQMLVNHAIARGWLVKEDAA